MLCGDAFFRPKVPYNRSALRVNLVKLRDRRLQINFLIGNRCEKSKIQVKTGTGSSFSRHFGLGKYEMPGKCAKMMAECRNRCTSSASIDQGSVRGAVAIPEVELIHRK